MKHFLKPKLLRRCYSKYENLIFEKKENIAIVKLNRPKALNALNKSLCVDLGNCFKEIENDSTIKVTILTGEGSKSFAAGADIKEMSSYNFIDVYKNNLFGELEVIKRARKPIIAAVNGFGIFKLLKVALGGGCELAMTCDIIIASENAKFGQPG